MFNALQRYLLETHRNEVEAMNWLQDRGLISDLCIGAEDVAEGDASRAVGELAHEALFGGNNE